MIHVPWKDRYNIHYQEVDQQHQELLTILNQLVELVGQRVEPEVVTGIFGQLCQYAIVHFTNEERFLEASGYAQLAKQRAEHSSFINRILELDRSYDPSDPLLMETTMVFLKDWFVHHIMKSDQDYAEWVKGFYERAEIRAVIFDFGGVIAKVDDDQVVERLAAVCDLPAELLRGRFKEESALFAELEAGVLSKAEFLGELARICGRLFTEEEFVPIFTNLFTPIPSTCELIRQLKSQYRLGLIANTNPWHFEHGIEPSSVFPLFDAVTVSFRAKARKPERRIFQDVLDQLDLVAEECVFIDDTAAFVDAANGYLLHGIQYRSYHDLLKDLATLKVIS